MTNPRSLASWVFSLPFPVPVSYFPHALNRSPCPEVLGEFQPVPIRKQVHSCPPEFSREKPESLHEASEACHDPSVFILPSSCLCLHSDMWLSTNNLQPVWYP